MTHARIVLYDALGELKPGTLIEGPAAIDQLSRRRVTLIPVDATRAHSAVGGVFRREWGAGWKFDRMVGSRGCPMLLHVDSSRRYVHWIARVVPVGPDPRGSLKVVTDVTPGAINAGVSTDVVASKFEDLKAPDFAGGWIVGGRNRLGVSLEGYLAVCLYGVARDVAVEWSAVSVTEDAADLFGLSG